MKVLHFILGKANPDRSNGVNYVIHGLCKYAAKAGHSINVVGVSAGMKETKEIVQRDFFSVEVYNSFFGECFIRLKEVAKEVDIVHLHSVWHVYNIIFANYLISINKPYVVTAHSGLTEDRIKQSNFIIKQVYHFLFQKRIFDKASAIHAITREEITSIIKYSKNNNIFFVPNGIDFEFIQVINDNVKIDKSIITFGYLGRFGTEKNIKGLINAISLLPQNIIEKIRCYLIGPLDNNVKELQKIISKNNLDEQIIFTGPKYGDEKYKFLQTLDFYIHPAFSDVVSIAVMEAMAVGLPAIITRTSQVSYYYNSNAFIMVEPIESEICKGILEIIENRKKWILMSENAKRLVFDIFNWQIIVELMNDEYSNILRMTSASKK